MTRLRQCLRVLWRRRRLGATPVKVKYLWRPVDPPLDSRKSAQLDGKKLLRRAMNLTPQPLQLITNPDSQMPQVPLNSSPSYPYRRSSRTAEPFELLSCSQVGLNRPESLLSCITTR